MKSEEEIRAVTIERTATVRLLKVTDLDKIIAGAADGSVSVEDLKSAGDYAVEVKPNGRNAEATRQAVSGEAAGLAWIEGFERCANLKKKNGRKPAAKPRATKPAAKGKGGKK